MSETLRRRTMRVSLVALEVERGSEVAHVELVAFREGERKSTSSDFAKFHDQG